VPGYRHQRSDIGPGSYLAGPGTPGLPSLSPSAEGAVGKGPIRGFPPLPGQPPPLYPPGQFAAWNRVSSSRDNQADPRGRGPAADAGWPADAAGDGAWPGQAPSAASGPDGREYDPGYSALAVSDPAADVTSTQTWQITSDGPDGPGTGAWTDLRGPAGPPPAAEPVTAGPPPAAGPATDRRAVATAPATATGRAAARAAGSRAGRSRPPGSRAAGPGGPRSGRKKAGRSSAVLAVCAVTLLAIAAVAFLLFTARHQGSPPVTASVSSPPKASGRPTASSSPTLGPFGHIASRAADPLPLTTSQLFPAAFSVSGSSFVRTVSRSGKSCGSAIVGSRLQSAVKAAQCSQVVRASYVSAASKVMGTIGVLNLGTSKSAGHAGHAAGASDFIAQLRSRRGATRQLGKGTGIEIAETKGHYLILIWAQFANRHKPRTAAQRKQLETFMTELFQQTANVSLTSRMVDGKP
jgi:hypothetical protein